MRPLPRLFALGLLLTAALTVRATETENLGLRLLPAPGKVVVDGKTADWDLSGSIFACGDVEQYRAKFGVWFAGMYDANNLYLLARWNDDTPLSNPGSTAGNFAWDGDSIQVRVVSRYGQPDEQINVFNCWKGVDGQDVVERDTKGKTKRSPKGDNVKPEGAQQAFQVAADGKGYTQEIAIPWALITAAGTAPKAGDSLVLTIEPNFTAGPTNGRMSIKDIFRPGVTLDRVFTFQNKTIWGLALLAEKGGVAPSAVRLSDGREFKVNLDKGTPVVDWNGLVPVVEQPGIVTLKFTMPEDGVASVQILDANDAVVRQLLTAEPLTKGPQEVKWDGLTTGQFRVPGQVVSAGKYSWRGIWHTGIGIQLRGWASNAGQTPWDGPAKGDNWGGDMGAPNTAAVAGDRVFLGWAGSEAGKALVVTDLDGIVQWRHKRGGFGGAQFVAVDGDRVFVVDSQDNALYCLKNEAGTYVPWAGGPASDVPVASLWPAGAPAPTTTTGLAARGGKLYLTGSTGADGLLLVLDSQTGKALNAIKIPWPGAITAMRDDLVYVVSAGTRVLAVNPQTGDSQPVIDGLANATGLALDAAGNFYVGTREPDHQVRVYSAEGKFLRAIGKAGGRPVLGPWQAAGMHEIAGLAVDGKGQLWVTEATLFPRRISVWNSQSGALIKELFGPTHYGASGGTVHPRDPNVMVGEGCEWRLDAKTGLASCVGVFDVNGGGYLGGHSFALFCQAKNKRDYLAVANAGIGADSSNIAIYERLAPGSYQLRSTITTNGKTKTTTFWADANGDRQVQPEETASYPKSLTLGGYYYWSINLNTDMTLYGGDGAFAVTDFTACGAPRYDLTKFKGVLGLPAGVPSLDNRLLLAPNYTCFDLSTGKALWSYVDQWHGVHGSHNAPPPMTGILRGTFGIVGCAKLPTVGYVWALNSNVGEWHLLTQDGYYLSRLFQPDALKVEFPAKVGPGAIITGIPCGMGGEDFGGALVQAPDGKVYLEAGKTALWNCQLTGLDTIKKLKGGTLKLDAAEIKQAEAIREQYVQASVGKAKYTVKRLTPVFTGKLEADFKGAAGVLAFQKQVEGAVRAAIAWDDSMLYLAWDVKDTTPWGNAASDPSQLYLSGDTVDFQLATDPKAAAERGEPVAGDLRLSIGNLQGQPTAVLFRKVSAEKKPRVFSSGVVKSYPMDYVDVIADAKVRVNVTAGKGYSVEAAIPLKALGLAAGAAATLKGDIGVTHGDPGSLRTRLRTYWSNQHTGIVDDAVYELMMEPKFWGELEFRP